MQHLFIGIKKRKADTHIYFALLSLCLAGYIFCVMGSLKSSNPVLFILYLKWQMFMACLALYLFLLFTESILNLKNRTVQRVILFYLPIPIIINYFQDYGILFYELSDLKVIINLWDEKFYSYIDLKNIKWTIVFYDCYIYSIYIYLAVLCIKAWRQNNKQALYLFIGYLFLFFSTFIDVAFQNGNSKLLTASEFSFSIFIILMSFNLANDVIRTSRVEAESRRLKEINKLKSRFFANISHEFRTPLTLILGPAGRLLKKAPEHKQDLDLIHSNALSLKELINQLLDLSRLEAGKLTLQISRVDFVDYVKKIAATFESLAQSGNIHYTLKTDVPRQWIWVDKDKMNKILSNILNNAFKFTTSAGMIAVNISKNSGYIQVSVQDNGIGIKKEQLKYIFDRFYQVDNGVSRKFAGSGIGLALVKELVELHHGLITVDSEPGTGSIFRISVPLDREELGDAIIIQDREEKEKVTFVKESGNIAEDSGTGNNNHPVVLIIEDNADVRYYLYSILKDEYRVILSENGREGLKKLKDLAVDMLICDIMMPLMDGIEFCKQVKTNPRFSHIPVIFLTAKASEESKIGGLETGADVYLTKPFSAAELKLTVRNILKQRERLFERFRKQVLINPSEITTTSLDEAFIKQAVDVVERHIDREEFDTSTFAAELHISRVHLNRKIKGICGQTPREFIKTIRLKRAYRLLEQKSATVSEIAYQVGFGNLSYFTKCFKKAFRKMPSDL